MNNLYKDVQFDIPQGYYLHGVESVHDYTHYNHREYSRYRVINICVLYIRYDTIFIYARYYFTIIKVFTRRKKQKSDLPIARGLWDTNVQCIYKVMLIGLLIIQGCIL